jgi:type I site-specific restriction-modification system R (restriction) subunit
MPAGKALNPNLDGREAFGTNAFQILLVANKFQTGFDQPLPASRRCRPCPA